MIAIYGLALLALQGSGDTVAVALRAAVDRVALHGLAAGGFPGVAVVVTRGRETLLSRGYGHVDWDPRSPAVDPARTLYDLASLTKVVATATAAMALYDAGRLSLDAPVSRYLPRWHGGGRERVTVRELLTHRAGLPEGLELWRVARTPAAARRAVLETPLVYPPGARSLYSDLGPDVLGFVIESITHERLDAYLAHRVYGPLGMAHTRFRPRADDLRDVARTEAPLGRVHDRAAAALGGVAGHAGLFASADDLARFARMMLAGGRANGLRIVSDSAIARFTTRTAGTRALGWDTCAGGASCGQYMGPDAYGHTGYTGTSMWIDPEHDLAVIVLANWASGTAAHAAGPIAILDDVRADIADLAVAAVAGRGGRQAVPPLAGVALRSDGARGWGLRSTVRGALYP